MPLALIESVKVGKRSEEAPRAHIVLSISLDDIDSVLLFTLERQVKNAVTVDFTDFQLTLAKRTSDADADADAQLPLETDRMSVDGEEADVVHPPLSDAAQALVNGAKADEGAEADKPRSHHRQA